MLRKQESKSIFQPLNNQDLNQWYFVDIQQIAHHLGSAPVLVDAITCNLSHLISMPVRFDPVLIDIDSLFRVISLEP